MNKTKATLETEYGTVSVEFNEGDLTVDKLFESVIEPLLLAAGYQMPSIERYYRGEL